MGRTSTAPFFFYAMTCHLCSAYNRGTMPHSEVQAANIVRLRSALSFICQSHRAEQAFLVHIEDGDVLVVASSDGSFEGSAVKDWWGGAAFGLSMDSGKVPWAPPSMSLALSGGYQCVLGGLPRDASLDRMHAQVPLLAMLVDALQRGEVVEAPSTTLSDAPDEALPRLMQMAWAAYPAGIALVTADGVVRGANDLFVSLLIGETERIAEEAFEDLLRRAAAVSEARSKLAQALQDLVSARVLTMGLPITMSEDRVIEISLIPLGTGGDVDEAFFLEVRDVSVRVAGERALSQQSGDTGHLEFLAHMAHELRTPLTALMGMSELLLDGTLPPEQQRYAQSVHNNVISLLELSDDLLDMAKIEAGAVEIQAQPVGLRDLVESSVEALAVTVRPDVELFTWVDPRLPAQVVADRGRIRQILANLLSNAIKYTDDGEIELRVSLMERREAEVDIEFSVRDTGQGIPYAEQERIFERYAQARRKTRTGTGLGLHITQSLAAIMGGTLSLVSRPGAGSTFSLRLTVEVSLDANLTLDSLRERVGTQRVALVSERRALHRAIRRLLDGSETKLVEESDPGVGLLLVDERLPQARLDEIARGGTPVIMLRPMGRDRVATHRDMPAISLPARLAPLLTAIAEVLEQASQEAVQEEAPKPKPPPREGVLQVLVVDDVADNRAIAQAALGRGGHDVQIASSGREALEFLRGNDYDVVLMDLHMPEMDGIETTRRLRAMEKEEGRPNVAVIAYTAESSMQVREEAMDAGCAEFVTKPVRPGELLAIVTRIGRPRGRVLVVDDSRDTRRALQLRLQRQGYLASVASDGAVAIEYMERNPADVVLMDVEMPGQGGLATVRAIRERGWTLPVIATTGHTERDRHREMLAAGYSDIVTKPFRAKDILERVDHWLSLASGRTMPPDRGMLHG